MPKRGDNAIARRVAVAVAVALARAGLLPGPWQAQSAAVLRHLLPAPPP